MSTIARSLIQELTQEATKTLGALDSIPADKLGWTPHKKSMPLGQLGTHIATIPQVMLGLIEADSFDMKDMTGVTAASSKKDILAAHTASIAAATKILGGWDDKRAMSTWQLLKQGQPIMPPTPRAAVVRGFLMNHLYHHRGQLTVYLRLLDVPVPSIYGPSADVNPFA